MVSILGEFVKLILKQLFDTSSPGGIPPKPYTGNIWSLS